MVIEPKVALVGAGYWGKNLARNLHSMGVLETICDVDPQKRSEYQELYQVRTVSTPEEIVTEGTARAVVIAAPAVRHYELARFFLKSGLDVFVEKPLALRSTQGEELVEIAAKNTAILMVGHLLRYHPAITESKRLIDSGELGKIRYIYSSRLNLGKLRTDENILWSFAPHDISAILYLLGETPTHVSGDGGAFVNASIYDSTLSTFSFTSGAKAHLFVSWLHPFKEQKLTIVGDKAMLVFDDVHKTEKLKLYRHSVSWVERNPIAVPADGVVVPLPAREPLRQECEHFIHCVESRRNPDTDGKEGVRVLKVIEACEESLRNQNQRVNIGPPGKHFYAHPTAVIDAPANIGEGSKIWHFSHVMAGSKIGKAVNIGQNVFVATDVSIGDNVKVQNNVSIYTGVEIESDVFCGPSMVFTNVLNPRSFVNRKNQYRSTRVKHGATIGANVTIVCGVTIGRFAFIGAGSVVTRDVPDYALMVGVPARTIGWMCACGIQLNFNKSVAVCVDCNAEYRLQNGVCLPLECANSGATPHLSSSSA